MTTQAVNKALADLRKTTHELQQTQQDIAEIVDELKNQVHRKAMYKGMSEFSEN